jgi:hypothetical protein
MPNREIPLHLQVLAENPDRRLSLQKSYRMRHAELRRYHQQHVDVIPHRITLD